MFGIGMQELLIVLIIGLVIFGVGKIPQIGSALGKGISNFKRSVSENDDRATDSAKLEAEKK